MKGTVMDLKVSRAGLLLEPHQIFGLSDAIGARLQVRRGRVWITQHEDGRDVTLSAGGGFTLDRPGLAVEDGAATSQRRWWGRAKRWIVWAFGPDAVDRRRPGYL
jgi:DUF2917 family protein